MNIIKRIFMVAVVFLMISTVFSSVLTVPAYAKEAGASNTGTNIYNSNHGVHSLSNNVKWPSMNLPPLPAIPAIPAPPTQQTNRNNNVPANVQAIFTQLPKREAELSGTIQAFPKPMTAPPTDNLNGGSITLTQVASSEIYENGTAYITNYTIPSGTVVTFKGVTIIVNGSVKKPFSTYIGFINILGTMEITNYTYTKGNNHVNLNSVIKNSIAPSSNYNVTVQTGGTLTIQNSTTVEGIGYNGGVPQSYGLYSYIASTVTIANTTFINGYVDLSINTTVPELFNDTFNQSYEGVYLYGYGTTAVNAALTHLQFNNDTYPLVMDGSSTTPLMLSLTQLKFYTDNAADLGNFVAIDGFSAITGYVDSNSFVENIKVQLASPAVAINMTTTGSVKLYNIMKNTFILNQYLSAFNVAIYIDTVKSPYIQNVTSNKLSSDGAKPYYSGSYAFIDLTYSTASDVANVTNVTNNLFLNTTYGLCVWHSTTVAGVYISAMAHNDLYDNSSNMYSEAVLFYSEYAANVTILNDSYNIIYSNISKLYLFNIYTNFFSSLYINTYSWNNVTGGSPASAISEIYLYYSSPFTHYVSNVTINTANRNVAYGQILNFLYIYNANIYNFTMKYFEHNRFTASTLNGEVYLFDVSPMNPQFVTGSGEFHVIDFSYNYINGTYIKNILNGSCFRNVLVGSITHNEYIAGYGYNITSFNNSEQVNIGNITSNTVYINSLDNFTNIVLSTAGFYGNKKIHSYLNISSVSNNTVISNSSADSIERLVANYVMVNSTWGNRVLTLYGDKLFSIYSASSTVVGEFEYNVLNSTGSGRNSIISNNTAMLYIYSVSAKIAAISRNEIYNLYSGDGIDLVSTNITIGNIANNSVTASSTTGTVTTPSTKVVGSMAAIGVYSINVSITGYIEYNTMSLNSSDYSGIIIVSTSGKVEIDSIIYNKIHNSMYGIVAASNNVTVSSVLFNEISAWQSLIFYSLYNSNISNMNNNNLGYSYVGVWLKGENVNVGQMNGNYLDGVGKNAYAGLIVKAFNISIVSISKLTISNGTSGISIEPENINANIDIGMLSAISTDNVVYGIELDGGNGNISVGSISSVSMVGAGTSNGDGILAVGYDITLPSVTDTTVTGFEYGYNLTALQSLSVKIDNANISGNGYGIYAIAMNGVMSISSSSIEYSSYALYMHGIKLTGNDLTICNNNVGLYAYMGEVNVTTSKIYNNSYGILSNLAPLNLAYSTLYNNAISINAGNSTVTVSSSNFMNSVYAIRLYNETGYVNNNSFNNVEISVFAAKDSDLVIGGDLFTNSAYSNSIYSAGAIFVYSGSSVTVYDGYFYNIRGYTIYSAQTTSVNWIAMPGFGNGTAYVSYGGYIYITGNITVAKGGYLYIYNMQRIEFYSPGYNMHGMNVTSGSKGTFVGYIEQISGNLPFYIDVYGPLDLEYATIYGASEVYIHSNATITITETVIENGYLWGIAIYSSTPTLSDDSLQNNNYFGGLLINMSYGVRLAGMKFQNDYNGMVLVDSVVYSTGITIVQMTYVGVYAVRSTVRINGAVIEGAAVGIYANSSTTVVSEMGVADYMTAIEESNSYTVINDLYQSTLPLPTLPQVSVGGGADIINSVHSTTDIYNSTVSSTIFVVLSNDSTVFSLNNSINNAPSSVYDTSKLVIESYERIQVNGYTGVGEGGVNVTLNSAPYIYDEKAVTNSYGSLSLPIVDYVQTSTKIAYSKSTLSLYDGVITYTESLNPMNSSSVLITLRIPPQFISVPFMKSVVGGMQYTYNFSVNDPYTAYGDMLNYSLINDPSGMYIIKKGTNSGEVVWNTTIADVGNWSYTIVAVNSYGEKAYENATIQVENNILSPTIVSTPVTVAKVGVYYVYDMKAINPSYGTLTYILTTAPAGMKIDAVTGMLTWVPTPAETGINYVVVMVEGSNGEFATQSFTINVTPYSDISYMSSTVTPVNSTSGNYTITLAVSDTLGIPVSSASVIINGVSYTMEEQSGGNGGIYTFVYRITLNPGIYVYTFNVTDATGASKILSGGVVRVYSTPATTPNYTGDAVLILAMVGTLFLIILALAVVLYMVNNRKRRKDGGDSAVKADVVQPVQKAESSNPEPVVPVQSSPQSAEQQKEPVVNKKATAAEEYNQEIALTKAVRETNEVWDKDKKLEQKEKSATGTADTKKEDAKEGKPSAPWDKK